MSADTEDPRCELIQDELSELALGTLYGRRRAEVLDHVGSCSRCSAALERLSVVADSLLQLAPEIEPPLGFELRLATRLQTSPIARRPRRLRRAATFSAAAVTMVALGFGLGTLATPRDGHRPAQTVASNLTSAKLTSHGLVVGQVVISPGTPAWMMMTINEGPWSGRVTCQVTLAGGQVDSIGAFTLTSGYGAWGAPLHAPADQVRSARLVDRKGAVLATAQLSV